MLLNRLFARNRSNVDRVGFTLNHTESPKCPWLQDMFPTVRDDLDLCRPSGDEYSNDVDRVSSPGILLRLFRDVQRILAKRVVLRLLCIVPKRWGKQCREKSFRIHLPVRLGRTRGTCPVQCVHGASHDDRPEI